jgi:hypothetical protein
MRSPQNYGSGLYFCHITQHISFTHHTASSTPTIKTLLGHPWDISYLGLCTKLTWFRWFLSSELFYPHCQEFWSPSSFVDPESCHHWPNLGATTTRQQDASPRGKARGPPFPRWNVTSRASPQIVGIKDPPVLKTDTQETENLGEAISFFFLIFLGNFSWSRGYKHVLTPAKQTHKHKMADSGSSLYPWHNHTCHSPGICPGQRFTVFPSWLKGLGDGLGHAVWWAMELYRNPEEEPRTL